MKITIDHSRCQGHAICQNNAPDLFVLNDDGYNRMEPFMVGPADETRAKRAVRLCPERAIAASSDGY